MAINSKVDLCNMAISLMGNTTTTISNIDTPTNDKERVMALWYDICRQFVLKLMVPNFALERVIVAQLSETPAFGYAYFYEYPNYALKVLGVGEIQDKENNYAIESTPLGVQAIAHDYDYTDGMPIRIIRDVTDVNRFSPETKLLLAQYISAYTCLPITQDAVKAKKLKDELPAEISTASGLNAQENRPVRISNSRFKAAKFQFNPNFEDKR